MLVRWGVRVMEVGPPGTGASTGEGDRKPSEPIRVHKWWWKEATGVGLCCDFRSIPLGARGNSYDLLDCCRLGTHSHLIPRHKINWRPGLYARYRRHTSPGSWATNSPSWQRSPFSFFGCRRHISATGFHQPAQVETTQMWLKGVCLL